MAQNISGIGYSLSNQALLWKDGALCDSCCVKLYCSIAKVHLPTGSFIWTADPTGHSLRDFCVSPDGKYIFASMYSTGDTIFMLDADTGETIDSFLTDSSSMIICDNSAIYVKKFFTISKYPWTSNGFGSVIWTAQKPGSLNARMAIALGGLLYSTYGNWGADNQIWLLSTADGTTVLQQEISTQRTSLDDDGGVFLMPQGGQGLKKTFQVTDCITDDDVKMWGISDAAIGYPMYGNGFNGRCFTDLYDNLGAIFFDSNTGDELWRYWGSGYWMIYPNRLYRLYGRKIYEYDYDGNLLFTRQWLKNVTGLFSPGVHRRASGLINWQWSVSYAKYDVVRYEGVYWESTQNSNVNHPPDISPTWWQPATGYNDAMITGGARGRYY